VSEVKGHDFNEAIKQLIGMSLLETSEALDLSEQRYSIHSLTRAFVKKKLGVDRFLNEIPSNSSNAKEPSLKISELKSRFYTFFARWSEKRAGRDYWGVMSWSTEVFKDLYIEMPNLLLSLEWAHECCDWECVLTLAKTIVHPIRHQGQVKKRVKCSEYGIEASNKLNIVEDEVWFTIDGLGLVYHQSGDHKKAKKYVLQGMQLAKKNNLPNAIAWGEVLLSLEALRTENLAEAQQHADEALRHAQDSYAQYRAYRAAGHVARHLGDYQQAEKHYLKCSKFLEGTEYRSSSDFYLGLTYLGLNQHEKAELYFRRTLRTHMRYGDQRMIARAKLGLAQTYTAQTEELFRRAVNLANESSEVFTLMNLKLELEQSEKLKKRLTQVSTYL
jgi:tetratricopeptide (TPR) repeat protein